MSSPKQTDAVPPGVVPGTVTRTAAPVEPAERAGIGTTMQDAMLAPTPRPVPAPPEDREFDAWLRGHLAALHAAVLEEPVPERFLRLLRGSQPSRAAGS